MQPDLGRVFLSLRADRIALLYIDFKGVGPRLPLWKIPVYTTVNNLLTNPVYAGAYALPHDNRKRSQAYPTRLSQESPGLGSLAHRPSQRVFVLGGETKPAGSLSPKPST